MTSFRTELHLTPAAQSLSLADSILTIGSCFSENIGSRLKENKFSCWSNLLGTIYNPLSIHQTLLSGINHQEVNPYHYTEQHGIWNHFDFHSQWGQAQKKTLQSQLQENIQQLHDNLAKASCLIITYGTAWTYLYNETKTPVANCHKVPQQNFTKVLATSSEISSSFKNMLLYLRKINPTIRVIVTVSPVRHIKDTIELNAVSKSILRVACHDISTTETNVDYFPAFEIMMDDLRDYRFYSKDLLHPSDTAIDYIWSKFSDRYFTPETKSFILRLTEIKTALHHKPFHPESLAHQKFLRELSKKIEPLETLANFEAEKQLIQSQLIINAH